MLFHYLFHYSLPLEGDDREVAQTEFFSRRSNFFLPIRGIFVFFLFYNINLSSSRNLFSLYGPFILPFPLFNPPNWSIPTWNKFVIKDTVPFDTPLQITRFFHFTHRGLPPRPSLQSSARPPSEVERLLKLSTQELSVFLFLRFFRVFWAKFFFSNNFALE